MSECVLKKIFLICEMNLFPNQNLQQIFIVSEDYIEDWKNIKGINMSFVSLFASPEYKSVSQNIIAALLFDIATEGFEKVDRQLVEEVFFESINDASENILRSDKTKRKLLNNLQVKNLEKELAIFRESGQPLDDDYFEKRFSGVISRKNAEKIAPAFLEIFRQKIADDPEFLEQVMEYYLEDLQDGAWEATDEEPEALAEIFEEMQQFEAAVPVEIEQPEETEQEREEAEDAPEIHFQKEFELVYMNNPQSGQVIHWNHGRYVLPVRGLRKLEMALSQGSLLYVIGTPGCGKSLLISAYLHNLVFNKSLEGKDIYYFRFVEGISDYASFVKSLTMFLDHQKLGGKQEDIARDLPLYVLRSRSLFVIDNLHQVKDPQLLKLIAQIWAAAEGSTTFRGKLIVVDRERMKDLTPTKKYHYYYRGLSIAESSALIRDKWRLEMPRMLARQLAKKFFGNPLLMLLFKNWWNLETHTDTELERFVDQMPLVDPAIKDITALRDFVAEHLYETFERIDTRLNSFLKAASVFRIPEQEKFFDQVYDRIGGGDIQSQLEKLVEKHDLVTYDDNLNRYEIHELVNDYYYRAIQSVQLKRILHNSAGQLYQERYRKSQKNVDAIEGAYHFRAAEREEESILLLEPVMTSESIGEHEITQVLSILEDVNFDLLDTDLAKMDVLYGRGRFYLHVGLLKQAEQDLLACDSLEPPDPLKASLAYHLGLIARSQGKIDRAFNLFQEALRIYDLVDDKKGTAEVYTQLSEIYMERGQSDFAFEVLTKSLLLYQELDDQMGSLHAYSHLGALSKEKHHWDSAYDYYHKSLEIYEQLHDYAGIATALKNLGEIHEVRGEWDEALRLFNREVKIDEKLKDPVATAKSYERIGTIHRQKGDIERAMEYYYNAQEILEDSDDLNSLASVYNNIGTVHFSRNEWDAAMSFFQKSQEIYEKTDSPDEYGRSFSQIANVYKALKQWERALDIYDKALEIKEKTEDSRGIAEIYENIGDIYHARGEFQYALEVYDRSIAMYETLNYDRGIAAVYSKVGQVHRNDKQLQKAIQSYQKAVQFYRKVNEKRGLADVYLALGGIFRDQREWPRALEFFRKSIELYQELKNPKGLSKAYYNVGTIYHDTSEWESALEFYRKSVPFFEESGDLLSLAQAMGNISSIEFERKEHIPAISKQVEILLYFQANNRTEMVERVMANLMACHQELGPNTFQALLNTCLEKIAEDGVSWGPHHVVPPDKAAKMIQKIFYSS